MDNRLLLSGIASAALFAGLAIAQAQTKGADTAQPPAAAGAAEPSGQHAAPPLHKDASTTGVKDGAMSKEGVAPKAATAQGAKAPGAAARPDESAAGSARAPATERNESAAAPTEKKGAGEKSGRSVGSARGNITPEVRTQVRTEISRVQVRQAPDVNISVHVGGAVPRTITEYWEPIPSSIVTIVPAWSAYRVIRVGNEILIIDPDTLEIVDVLQG